MRVAGDSTRYSKEYRLMPETAQLTLPVLPLPNGVVFPHMVVTIRIETEEGRSAIAAASKADGRLLLVPRLEGRYAAGVAERLLDVDNPSRLADLAVYSPDLSLEQKVELLEALDIRQRLGKLLVWMREVLADLELRPHLPRLFRQLLRRLP
jgi:ATP-dependent Lon protease